MADEKLTQQTETTDIADDDILYVVRDPATVPISRKMKFSNLVAEFPDATDAVEGKVELATTDEASAGTDTSRAVTPAGLLAGIVENPGGAFLASTVLATTDTTYTFSTSDFPASYEHLIVRGWDLYSSCDNTTLHMRLNGDDTGTRYGWIATSFTTSTTLYQGAASTDIAHLSHNDALRSASTLPLAFEMKIFNYSGTAFNKAWFGTYVSAGVYTGIFSGTWASTDAITSLTFFSGANTLTGTIAIYGFNT